MSTSATTSALNILDLLLLLEQCGVGPVFQFERQIYLFPTDRRNPIKLPKKVSQEIDRHRDTLCSMLPKLPPGLRHR